MVRTTYRTPLDPARAHAARDWSPPLPPVDPARRPPLGATADPVAQRLWQAHVDAGRIGGAPPPPAPGADHGCAGLAAILGLSLLRGVAR